MNFRGQESVVRYNPNSLYRYNEILNTNIANSLYRCY
jgi:hypothetical protein